MVAELVLPAAEAIQSAQEQADLANYNKRFDSFRQVADSMERLQHRREADLPAVPTLESGGDPDLWKRPAVEVLPDAGPVPSEQVADLVADLRESAVYPGPPATVREEWRRQQAWSADEAINPDGLAEALERWKRGERG